MSSPDAPKPEGSDKERWPHSRPPTVADLRTKLCWICREEESSDEPAVPQKVWVHSCNCTLVAHESCLLTWIRLQDAEKKAENAMKCPQCKTKFQISSQRTWTLTLLDHVHDLTSRAARIGAVTVFTVSALGVSALYGSYAIRCFVGNEMGDLIIGGRDPRQWRPTAFLNLPFVPWLLILHRTRLLKSVVNLTPFLIIPVNLLPRYSDRWLPLYDEPLPFPFSVLEAHDIGSNLRPSITAFPPSPAVLFSVLPVVQWGYQKMFSQAFKWLMTKSKSLDRSGRRTRNRPLQAGAPRPEDQVLVDALQGGEPDAGANAIEDGEPEEENELPQDLAAALDRGEQVNISGTSLCRMVMGSLVLPPISSLLGSGLFELANWLPSLKPILGIKAGGTILSATSGKGLLSAMTLGLGAIKPKTYHDIDPVWWRNVLGLCMFIFVKDGVKLWHQYLKAREKRSRKILSRPFENVDFNELDLRI